MYIDKYREVITSSTCNIPQRLRQIDKGYFLVRNHCTKQFEVHHSEEIGNTFCLSIPFNELDERTLQRVRETRIEYIRNIIAEIDNKNEKIEIDGDKELKDVTQTVGRNIYKYVKVHESKETIDEDSKYFKKAVS
ncbi:hypothetical protein ACJDU8_17745 [Clostridium sp. WILCCON 0269]|uniref:Uncharacterized protein n=1 Tax=Candidatus Clostridium eludens TaxID=3381663 RepID=A0ABW8SN57_9CLOT